MYRQIMTFWFEELQPSAWWTKDPQLDEQIRQRFGELHRQASVGELWRWRAAPEGRLAEIIILDQFSRHIYRDQPGAFAQDAVALVLAQEALAAGADQQFPRLKRRFFYMPYMHSESMLIHQQAMELFSAEGMEEDLGFEVRHREVIQRFGRYPHRNAILGRDSTEAEREFLTQPGSSF